MCSISTRLFLNTLPFTCRYNRWYLGGREGGREEGGREEGGGREGGRKEGGGREGGRKVGGRREGGREGGGREGGGREGGRKEGGRREGGRKEGGGREEGGREGGRREEGGREQGEEGSEKMPEKNRRGTARGNKLDSNNEQLQCKDAPWVANGAYERRGEFQFVSLSHAQLTNGCQSSWTRDTCGAVFSMSSSFSSRLSSQGVGHSLYLSVYHILDRGEGKGRQRKERRKKKE